MRLARILPLTLAIAVLIPASAFALEGIGPRVTVVGTVTEVRITPQQAFAEEGAEVIVKASNGQVVTIIVTKETQILSEGRLSRKRMIPVNIVSGMQVRVRGWRVGTDSLTASLFVISNIELNPVLSQNGVLKSIDGGKITVLRQDGQNHVYTITNETEVNINYTLHGVDSLTLIGKQVLLTLNPNDTSLVRILRITGDKPLERTAKPTTIDLGVRTVD